MKRSRTILLFVLILSLVATAIASAAELFVPMVSYNLPPTHTPTPTPTHTPTVTPTPTITPSPTPDPDVMTEVRGLWVSRFDWTVFGQPANQAKIDEIVDNAAFAGFNTIYFQVRGTADAYYTPGLEPWAQRVSGQWPGQWPSPVWDPLAYFIEKAHAKGIELHAYLNVYPIWDCNSAPNQAIWPKPVYHELSERYGTSQVGDATFLNGLQWYQGLDNQCLGSYNRASPASLWYDEHLIAVGTDLVNRYDIDGLHLDHIRYGGPATSCDPVSLCRYNGQGENCSPVPACDITNDYKDWQRQQINGTVSKFYNQIIEAHPDLWLTAAVWPIHTNKWGWAASQGYHDYYQDSKGWQAGGYIDSISPMIYPGLNCAEDSAFWTRNVWETLVWDYQAERSGRFVVPGIGSNYCDFAEIEWRINKAREIGTAGHALFSYSHLNSRNYFDDLANGPYQKRAVVPALPWR